MWFLLFSLGAVLLGAVGLPAARHLPLPPPPEALVACYFLLATLLRLLVRNARLAAFERKARKEARRREDQGKKPASVIGELGLGVGRGALQAVGGDLLGAGLSLASALLRGAASSMSAPPPPPRERRRAARWEQLKAATCVVAVGLVCAGVAWEPLVHGRLRRAADAAMTAGLGTQGASVQAAGMGATLHRPPGPAATPTANPTLASTPASPASADPSLAPPQGSTSAPAAPQVSPVTPPDQGAPSTVAPAPPAAPAAPP